MLRCSALPDTCEIEWSKLFQTWLGRTKEKLKYCIGFIAQRVFAFYISLIRACFWTEQGQPSLRTTTLLSKFFLNWPRPSTWPFVKSMTFFDLSNVPSGVDFSTEFSFGLILFLKWFSHTILVTFSLLLLAMQHIFNIYVRLGQG